MTVDDLVARLDLPSKVRLLTGASMFTLHDEPAVGLAAMAMSDGPTGVRGVEFSTGPRTSLFPNATLLAASWSEDVAHTVGGLLAQEAERQHVHVVLGPTVNLHRSPLGGRLFEAFSEDPLLTGRLAAAYVRGLQERGIGACVKHLVANESETDRHTVNSVVDERTLREVYLLPFEIAISDADAWSVMAAYNLVNGLAATEQHEVNNGILKDEWGWTGLLVSDWFATTSTAAAANGGLDLVMPGPNGPWGAALVAAVEAGEVTTDAVDDHVRRLLLLADRVGALGEQRTWPSVVEEPDGSVRRAQLMRLAVSGMTVLTNDGTLPLRRDRRVALVGRLALDTTCMGGGSAQVRAPHQVSIAEGLGSRMPGVTVADGVAVRSRPRSARRDLVTDPVTGQPGIRVQVYVASGAVVRDEVAGEGFTDVDVVGGVDERPVLARLTARVPAGRLRVGALGVGDWTVRVAGTETTTSLRTSTDDLAEAILRPPGWQTDVTLEHEGELVAEVDLRHVPNGHGLLGLVVEPTPPTDDEAIAAAVAQAADSEVAVVVVGLTEEEETEAFDKTTLALPGRQDELVSAVAAVAPRTVVVVNAATPVLMPWLHEVHAVLWAGIPGQEGGHAVAAALLGEQEPAGRLVTTFPVADGATPAWEVVPVGGEVHYSEGTFVGHRGHFAGAAPAPLFWFGHGLGYGSWDYGRVEVEGRTVFVELTNTSTTDSREVVQVYFDPRRADQPVRLAGWVAAEVAAGDTVTVRVRCDDRMWRTWDPAGHAWGVLDGGELLVARGLGDVRHVLAL